MINYEFLPEFEKDFKALFKRFQMLDSDFERFKREQEAMMNSMKQNDSLLLNKLEKECQDYVKAEQEAYGRFVEKMSAVWGGDNVVESSNKEWVEYSDNGNSRSCNNFKKFPHCEQCLFTL